jgi:Leucine Rich repeat
MPDRIPIPPGRVSSPPGRRRWRLTLRMAMLLVLIVAGGMGWEVKLARDQKTAAEAIRAYGGEVIYDYEMVNGVPTPGREPAAPRWLRSWLGEDFFREVVVVNLCRDADEVPTSESSPARDAEVASRLRGLPGVTLLAIRGAQASDATIVHIRGMRRLEILQVNVAPDLTDAGAETIGSLPSLKHLVVTGSRLTDRGLEQIAGLPRLESLYYRQNHATDRGLEAISRSGRLRVLHFGDNRGEVTDAGVESLARLKDLEVLNLRGTQMTDRGLATFRELPKLLRLMVDAKDGPRGANGLVSYQALLDLGASRPGLQVSD